MALQVFVNANFEGHWPVGTAAVIVAESQEAAADALRTQLAARGLGKGVEVADCLPVPLSEPKVIILRDGDY